MESTEQGMANKSTEKKSAGKVSPLSGFSFERLTFKTAQQQAFLEDFATLVEDGVPANKAVEVLQQVSEGPTKTVANNINNKIAQGKAIADGMAGWFPYHVVELIRVGETGGTLTNNIRVAAKAMGQRSLVLKAIIGALTYPTVVFIMACFVIMRFNAPGSILPQFLQIKPVEQWPDAGKHLYWVAVTLQNGWWIILLCLIGAGIGIGAFLRNYVGPGREAVDKIPLLQVYRQLTAARFMETLGLLISHGVVFKKALSMMQNQASAYLGYHLMLMERKLGKGRGNIAEVLDTGLVDSKDIIRLKAIAAAKGFEHGLIRQGQQAAQNGMDTVRKVAKIFGVIILMSAAILAVIMVLGIYNTASMVSS